MRRTTRLALVGATVTTVATSGTVIAYADWSVPGGATVRGRAASMPRGVTPSVTELGGKAVVRWSAQAIAPGVTMQRYTVTAHSAESPPMTDVVRVVTAGGADTQSTTFSAPEMAGSRWYWTVTPRFELWVGDESRNSDKLDFRNSPMVAGTAITGGTVSAPTSPTTPTPATRPDPADIVESPGSSPSPVDSTNAPAESVPEPPQTTATPAPAADPTQTQTLTTSAPTEPDDGSPTGHPDRT